MKRDCAISYVRLFPDGHPLDADTDHIAHIMVEYAENHNLFVPKGILEQPDAKVPRQGIRRVKRAMRKYGAKGLLICRHNDLWHTPQEIDEVSELFNWMAATNRILHVAVCDWSTEGHPEMLTDGLLTPEFNEGVKEGEALAWALYGARGGGV